MSRDYLLHVDHIKAWRRATLGGGTKGWLRRHPEIAAAHRAFSAAVRNGSVTRKDFCERCGERWGQIHAHHEDYSRPLDVVYFCAPCHRRRHQELKHAGEKPLPPLLPDQPPRLFETRIEWLQDQYPNWNPKFAECANLPINLERKPLPSFGAAA